MKLSVPVALNLVSVILLSGSAWQGVFIYKDGQTRSRAPRTGGLFSRLKERVEDQQPESAWLNSVGLTKVFADANFVGAPDETQKRSACGELPTTGSGSSDQQPSLAEILEVSAIVFASHGPSRVIVTYLQDAAERPTQQLKLEGRLRAPHDHYRLVRIAADASCVWFVREDPEGDEELALCRVEFEISEPLAQALAGVSGQAWKSSHSQAEDKIRWSPTEETVRVADNSWSIGKDDVALVRVDGLQRIFHQDLSLSGYASCGGVRGVQVRRASKRMKGLGVVPGDVIVGVNGESVETKAKAIVVLRRLYKRGVRSFDIEFVSRGRQMTRTYRVPD